jgi:hypothetical protein
MQAVEEKKWGVFVTGVEIHVIPLNDKREHFVCIDCPCRPSYENNNKLIVIHNAFDFREIMECLREI